MGGRSGTTIVFAAEEVRLTPLGLVILASASIFIAYGVYSLSKLHLVAGFSLVILLVIDEAMAKAAARLLQESLSGLVFEPRVVFENEPVKLRLRLGGVAIPLHATLTFSGSPRISATVCISLSGVELEREFIPGYGRVCIRRVEANVVTLLGLYEARVRGSLRTCVYGLPRPEYRRALTAAMRGLWLYGVSSNRPGVGSTYFYTREYTPDDDARLIDWKSSARHARLFVRVFESERLGSLLLVLDATPTLRDVAEAARLLATIGYAALSSGCRVQAVTVSDGLYSSGWASSPRMLRRVLQTLAEVEAGRLLGCRERLEQLIRLERLARAHATVVIVTDFCREPNEYERVLHRLSRVGRVILIAKGKAPNIPGVMVVRVSRFWEALKRLEDILLE